MPQRKYRRLTDLKSASSYVFIENPQLSFSGSGDSSSTHDEIGVFVVDPHVHRTCIRIFATCRASSALRYAMKVAQELACELRFSEWCLDCRIWDNVPSYKPVSPRSVSAMSYEQRDTDWIYRAARGWNYYWKWIIVGGYVTYAVILAFIGR